MAARVFGGGFAILLVWFASPSWIGTPGRILMTMLILMAWPVWVLIRHFRRPKAERPPEPAEAPAPTPARRGKDAAPAPPRHTYEELTQGAREVVQLLRDSKHAGSGDPGSAVPWYVIAGPRSSGKSSLLRASGMGFQVLPSQRAGEQHLIRPTRQCDWRVADGSVWLDTAGRYQTEMDERDEWAALVETVKRHRKQGAVEGYVLVVSARAVLDMDEDEAERQAKLLRSGLNDAMLRAGARFPVYLVFTHMDEVDGFPDFFASINEKERAQVWGATIPLAESENGHARFDREFERLYWRLIHRRVLQLGTAPGPNRQLRVFKFPGQFRRAQAALGGFTKALFGPSPYSQTPLLRGFYFTGIVAADEKDAGGDGYYFAQRLFSEVMLPDRNIVAARQALAGRRRLGRTLLLGSAAALVLVFMAGIVVSYFGNKELIERADGLGRRLVEVRKYSGRQAGAGQNPQEVGVLRDVRTFLEELETNERESPPLSLRFGLYAGDRINSSNPSEPSLRHFYLDAVQDRFMKNAVAGIEAQLRTFASGAGRPASADAAGLDKYHSDQFDLLKVYLMLTKRGRVEDEVDSKTYENVLRPHFSAPGVPDDEAHRHLAYLARQAHKPDALEERPDAELIRRARARLADSYPIINHVYKGMVDRVQREALASGYKDVKLAAWPGVAGSVLTGEHVVPAAFTYDGHKVMADRIESSAAEDFRKQEWVMRDERAGEQEFDARKRADLFNMYYGQYRAHWQKALEDLRLTREYSETEDTVNTLRTLSGRMGGLSPLEAVLREAASETNLSASRGVWGWIKGLFGSEPSIGGTPVEVQFRPLILFVAGRKGAALNKYFTTLQSVADGLQRESKSLADVSKALQANPGSAIGLKAGREAVEQTLAENGFGAGDAAAKLLRLPLDTLHARLAVIDFEQLEKRWQELYAKAQQMEGRFPFSPEKAEVPLTTITLFFNPQDGELANFFKDRLGPYFKNDWTPQDGNKDKFSPQFVAYLAAARRLSEALFPGGGKQPSASYRIDLVKPPEGWHVTVEIDGNKPPLNNERPSRQFKWPGDGTGVRANIVTTEGGDSDTSPFTNFSNQWGVVRLHGEKGGQFSLGGVNFRLQPEPANPGVGDVFRKELFKLRAPKELRPARPQ